MPMKPYKWPGRPIIKVQCNINNVTAFSAWYISVYVQVLTVMLECFVHCIAGNFEDFYLDISKDIISVKIKLIEIKCVTI